MFKTDKDLDNTNYKEPIESKFLQVGKKKYYLASVDHNLNQLKDEQLNVLTNLLISLKSEYDDLKRQTIVKDRETEELKIKIQMMEKVVKKIGNKTSDMQEDMTKMESLIEMKKNKRDEEFYNKSTYQSLIEKLKDEMLVVKKDINTQDAQMKVLNKQYEKERIEENAINEKINHFKSKIDSIKNRNSFEKGENNMILQYYQNIIEQKWSFIHSADERKSKQVKIAIDAKNDSQDKQEVEKRKIFYMYILYDKYLKRKMEKELLENAKLEETFQTIRDITGSSNIKTMVDKIMNKDKNYNLCVSKVSEKQNEIEILNRDIFSLEKDFQKLKNNITDEDLNKPQTELLIEEDQTKLLKEEKSLIEELKLLQDKHRNVKMVYEKVIENIKNLCKMDKKEETIIFNESKIDTTQIASPDEDLGKNFYDYLENTKKTFDSLIANNSKENFVKLMAEKGIEPVQTERVKTKAVSNKEEYDYSDDELKREDDEIKIDKDQLMKQFKEQERIKFEQAIKAEKDAKK